MADNRSIDSFPEEAQAYIRELRSENAQYRTERNTYRDEATELRNKYTEAGQLLKTANDNLSELSAIKDTNETNAKALAEKTEAFDRLVAAAKFKLDPEDAGRLQGSNLAEWTKDAESLAQRMGVNKPAGVPKNPGAGAPTNGTPPKEDGITAAFRTAGLLP